jgi:hypothetical protein
MAAFSRDRWVSTGSSRRNMWAPCVKMDSTMGQRSCLERIVCKIDGGRNSEPKEHEDPGMNARI